MLIPITRTIKNFYLLYYGFTAAFLSSFCCNPLGTTVFGLRSARCAQEFSCISLIFRTFVPILSRLCLFCLFSWFFLSSIYVETQPACASCVYMSYIFVDRCAVVRIKFTLFGFYRFHVAQYSALQLLPPSAHIPCTLLVCLVCRIFHNICNSDIHFCSLCLALLPLFFFFLLINFSGQSDNLCSPVMSLFHGSVVPVR